MGPWRRPPQAKLAELEKRLAALETGGLGKMATGNENDDLKIVSMTIKWETNDDKPSFFYNIYIYIYTSNLYIIYGN